jgi:hypothetical protein
MKLIHLNNIYMKSLKFLNIMFRTIFNQDIIYQLSRHFTRNMYIFFYKKRSLIKYRLKFHKERKKLTTHYYYH